MADRVTYKYKWRLFPLIWLLVLTAFFIWIGIAWISREGWQGGVAFLLISLSLEFAIGWTLIMALADITIDGEQILRRAYGITWQRMAWSDVKRISCRQSMNPEDGKRVRQFVLTSTKGYGLLSTKRIIFQERLTGMRDLLEKFNCCVDQYEIKIVNLDVK
jgi:hypothetical protein